MTFETIPGTAVEYGLISFDEKGQERAEGAQSMSSRLIDKVANSPITNVFFFCHGWKGDLPAAKDQYNRWIGALMRSADLQRAAQIFPNFSPLLIGLHWPSLPWGDEEISGGAFAAAPAVSPEQLLESYVQRLGNSPALRAPLQIIFDAARHNIAPESMPDPVRKAYLDLNDALGLHSEGVDAPPDADREGFDPDLSGGDTQSFGAGDLNLGGILGPLRQLSYWTMKKRARSIGEGAMNEFLRNVLAATATRGTRVHLMGHSFGTIVVSSMVGGANARGQLPRPIDSLALVQGAVSLWSYASAIPFPDTSPGYFNRILADGKVKGPIVVTQSVHDKAVRLLYPFASKISGSVEFPAGQLPEFGGIGTFGIQGVPKESLVEMKMLDSDGQYGFEKQRIYNLESSQFIAKEDGLSGAHSDIAGPQVAHAIWEAAFASK